MPDDTAMSLRSRLRRPLPALLVVSALALAARLLWLGARVAHQDEGRLADWIFWYMQTGAWEYRAIIHAGFLPHVVPYVFQAFGMSDFTMRLLPAVVGGLLPLAAYLYRDYLDDDEVVAFGLVLAATPALLYYTRFLRYDPFVVASMMTALGCWLHARASGKARYLYAGTFVFALAFTMKENALLYPVAWLGALALVVDRHLLVARLRGEGVARRLRALVASTARGLRPWLGHLAVSLVLFAVVVVLLYAPIPEVYGMFSSPDAFVSVLDSATLGSWDKFVNTWTGAHMSEHSTVSFLRRFGTILASTATVTLAFATVGFVRERYGSGESRDLVEFCFYWGAASILGYAIIMDVMGGWAAVHVVAPLAIPAAAGLAWVYRVGSNARRSGDRVAFGVAAALLLLASATVGGTAAYTSYTHSQDPSNPLVQYAQPAGEMKPTLHDIRDISAEHDGIDVIFYGDEFYTAGEFDEQSSLSAANGTYDAWFERLPLPWYFDRYGTRVASTTRSEQLAEYDPPVVITLEKNEAAVRATIDASEYDVRHYQGYQSGRPLVFFVRK